MSAWWDTNYRNRKRLTVSSPNGLPRTNEPVLVDINFEGYVVHPNSIRLIDSAGNEVPSQTFATNKKDGRVESTGLAFLSNIGSDDENYFVYFDARDCGTLDYKGIGQLRPDLEDGVKRLDTGHYVLELCRGTGDGTSAGKWGIRYFEAKSEGKNLIQDCSNAIGGFYGPFFTPSNGLINPPGHMVVECHTEVEGPIYCEYRFRGMVPSGLDPNLRHKSFEIVWRFFYDSPWIIRTYNVDEYSTVVDEMPVSNKITVGDEFESGQDNVVFSRFGAYGGTQYRAGDLYAQILAREVYRLFEMPEGKAPQGLKEFKEVVGDDINRVSWDYFWRLFCVQEGVLSDREIYSHVQEIVREAHKAVHYSPRHKELKFGDLVDVSREPDQTIFPVDAQKTVELNPESGYSMVWYTSSPVARYQIVQRPDSGWVNWGTNGENEYPELPIGSTIYSAYGRFARWKDEADKMETPVIVTQGETELL